MSVGRPLRAALVLALPLALVRGAPAEPPAIRAAVAQPALTVVRASRIAGQSLPALRGSEPDTVAEADVAVSPRDPRVALAVVQDGRYPDGGSVGISYAWTHDAERHWRSQALPGLTPASGGPATWRRASDPVAAFDDWGRAYVSMLLVTKSGPSAVAVSRSLDGGRTFGRPVVVHRTRCEHCDDKPWLVVDTGVRSPYRGRLYLLWTRLVHDAAGRRVGARQLVAWSDDHGRRWSAPVGVTPRNLGTQGSQPLPGKDGTLVDVYLDLGTAVDEDDRTDQAAVAARRRLVTRISRNGGRSWVRGGTISARVGTGPAGVRCCLPSATRDPVTGRLYAAWVSPDARRVLVSSSADGRRWSAALALNRSSRVGRVVNVDVSAYAGTVAVSYGFTTAAAPARLQRQRVAVSGDAGGSFRLAAVLGPRSDHRYAARAPLPFPGDYVGSAMHGSTGYAVWCVSRRPASGARFHQVLYGATFRVG